MQSHEPEVKARLERVVALSDRLTLSISTLVALARARPASGQRVNPASAVMNVIDGTRVPDGTRVDVDQYDGSIDVATTIEMLERILAPLVENALRFATSRVFVAIVSVDRIVSIVISDDGPGVDLDAECFGAGLGLALAQRLAVRCG